MSLEDMEIRDFQKGQTYHLFNGRKKPDKIHIYEVLEPIYKWQKNLIVYKFFRLGKGWYVELITAWELEYRLRATTEHLKEKKRMATRLSTFSKFIITLILLGVVVFLGTAIFPLFEKLLIL